VRTSARAAVHACFCVPGRLSRSIERAARASAREAEPARGGSSSACGLSGGRVGEARPASQPDRSIRPRLREWSLSCGQWTTTNNGRRREAGQCCRPSGRSRGRLCTASAHARALRLAPHDPVIGSAFVGAPESVRRRMCSVSPRCRGVLPADFLWERSEDPHSGSPSLARKNQEAQVRLGWLVGERPGPKVTTCKETSLTMKNQYASRSRWRSAWTRTMLNRSDNCSSVPANKRTPCPALASLQVCWLPATGTAVDLETNRQQRVCQRDRLCFTPDKQGVDPLSRRVTLRMTTPFSDSVSLCVLDASMAIDRCLGQV
jgi:hypothetical protein